MLVVIELFLVNRNWMFVLLLNRERKQINIHLFIIRNILIGQQDQISYGEQITILPMVVFACQMYTLERGLT